MTRDFLSLNTRPLTCLAVLINLMSACDVAQGIEPAGDAGKANAILKSGPAEGATVTSFFVRAVTGPHRNRSVCYVCRFGARPVVMVLLQEVDPKIARLLRSIDQLVDAGRVEGIRAFGVLVTDDSSKVVPVLQTLAFDEKLELPLTAATTAVASPTCHNLHPDAATTIVLYRNQKVVTSLSYRQGTIDEAAIETIRARIQRFINEP